MMGRPLHGPMWNLLSLRPRLSSWSFWGAFLIDCIHRSNKFVRQVEQSGTDKFCYHQQKQVGTTTSQLQVQPNVLLLQLKSVNVAAFLQRNDSRSVISAHQRRPTKPRPASVSHDNRLHRLALFFFFPFSLLWFLSVCVANTNRLL